jgi:hypothetical protein
MYNPQLGLALWVNGPNAADPEYPGRKRYVLIDCGDGTVGEAETDVELCALVASAHAPRFSPTR